MQSHAQHVLTSMKFSISAKHLNTKSCTPSSTLAYTLYTCSHRLAVGKIARSILCNTLHSLIHLNSHIPTVGIAASGAVHHIVLTLAATARSVKAVFSVQLEGQNVGQGQAITVGWVGFHKEQCALHNT